LLVRWIGRPLTLPAPFGGSTKGPDSCAVLDLAFQGTATQAAWPAVVATTRQLGTGRTTVRALPFAPVRPGGIAAPQTEASPMRPGPSRHAGGEHGRARAQPGALRSVGVLRCKSVSMSQLTAHRHQVPDGWVPHEASCVEPLAVLVLPTSAVPRFLLYPRVPSVAVSSLGPHEACLRRGVVPLPSLHKASPSRCRRAFHPAKPAPPGPRVSRGSWRRSRLSR
jgi:hypothetical protein